MPDILVAHLSDLHLGRKSSGDPRGAERLNSLRRAVSLLAEHSPAAIVVAGDTFDAPGVDAAVVREAARALDGAQCKTGTPIPVVVIPGNHDPSEAAPLWSVFQTALGPESQVVLALEPRVTPLLDGKLIIEAYPCETRYSAEAPWAHRLPREEHAAGVVRVVVAHGTLQGGPVPDGESDAFPFSQTDLEELSADYVALGHFHKVYPPWPSKDPLVSRGFCYSGTHEPDQFDGGAGNLLLATLASGKPARLERVQVGRRIWKRLGIATAGDLDDAESLKREVENHTDPSRFIIDFRLGANCRLSQQEAGNGRARCPSHPTRRGAIRFGCLLARSVGPAVGRCERDTA